MNFYNKSLAFIQEQKLQHPDMSHQDLRKHCSKNYPFAERRGYAYKAFLRAMAENFGRTRMPPKTEQIEIFEQTEIK